MPIYEYECTECGNVIEVLQKVNSRRAPGRCEECSGKLVKKISRTSFQLKGGGWYADGYGPGGSSSGSKSTSSSKSSKSGGSKKCKKAGSA